MMLSTLNAACMTVNYAPMLSVLFLGTRMRAVQLSGGLPDKYDLPQPYVKTAMWFCVCAVQIQTLIVQNLLCLGLFRCFFCCCLFCSFLGNSSSGGGGSL